MSTEVLLTRLKTSSGEVIEMNLLQILACIVSPLVMIAITACMISYNVGRGDIATKLLGEQYSGKYIRCIDKHGEFYPTKEGYVCIIK